MMVQQKFILEILKILSKSEWRIYDGTAKVYTGNIKDLIKE